MPHKSFDIRKQGVIKNGRCSYSFGEKAGDPDEIRILYNLTVTAGWLFFSKTLVYPNSDMPIFYDVDSELLKPETFRIQGNRVQIGVVTFTVTATYTDFSVVQVEIDGQDLRGTATVQTSNTDYVELLSLKASGKISGFKVEIELVPETGRRRYATIDKVFKPKK